MWIITLVGLVFICIYGVEESKPLIAELDLVFRDLITRKDIDPRADRILATKHKAMTPDLEMCSN